MNIRKLFGFDDEEAYEDFEEQDEMPRGPAPKRPLGMNSGASSMQRPRRETLAPVGPKLVFFKGVPSDDIKLRLRDALLEGTMVLLDLNGLPHELEEEGMTFITFMKGVAFAHHGRTDPIDQSMYLLTPYEGMFQMWVEEDH